MLSELVGHLSYSGLFLVLLATGVGMPVPEELPIVIAGVLARHETMQWWAALPVCMAGVVAADATLYWVGRRFGRRILRWGMVRRVLTPAREARITEAYRRHGLKFVVVARLVMGLRAAAFLTAGLVRVPFARFLAVDAAASLVSVPVSFWVAYAVVGSIAETLAHVQRLQLWIAGVVLLVALGWVVAAARRHRRR